MLCALVSDLIKKSLTKSEKYFAKSSFLSLTSDRNIEFPHATHGPHTLVPKCIPTKTLGYDFDFLGNTVL